MCYVQQNVNLNLPNLSPYRSRDICASPVLCTVSRPMSGRTQIPCELGFWQHFDAVLRSVSTWPENPPLSTSLSWSSFTVKTSAIPLQNSLTQTHGEGQGPHRTCPAHRNDQRREQNAVLSSRHGAQKPSAGSARDQLCITSSSWIFLAVLACYPWQQAHVPTPCERPTS